jgi:hypothetical protein
MKTRRINILLRLDNALRWTGVPARVADEMSDAPSVDRKHRPLRWIPIWMIAFSCALFILSLTWPSTLNLVALRKDSFLFCLGLLACLNCLGQPFLMILSHLQNWQTAQSAGVAASGLMLNATLFGCSPTLYASWNLRQLPKE